MPDMPKNFDPSGVGKDLQGNTRMAQLGEDSRAIERKVKDADRQKKHKDRKKPSTDTDIPKKVRKRRLPDNVKQLDISLKDAEKLNLISKEVKELLENGHGKYAPKIETLRQAYEYIKDKPFVIGSYLNPEEDIDFDKAQKLGRLNTTETDNITFSAIAEQMGKEVGLKQSLSWGQTAAFVELFPEVFKETSKNTGLRKTHFGAPINKLIASWKEKATDNIDGQIDLRETVIDIAEGWTEFLESSPHNNSRYEGVQIMYPVKRL